jgi:hypothetical protein
VLAALLETEVFAPINHHQVGSFSVNVLVLRCFVRHQQAAASNYVLRGQILCPSLNGRTSLKTLRGYLSDHISRYDFCWPGHEYEDKVRVAEDVKKVTQLMIDFSQVHQIRSGRALQGWSLFLN